MNHCPEGATRPTGPYRRFFLLPFLPAKLNSATFRTSHLCPMLLMCCRMLKFLRCQDLRSRWLNRTPNHPPAPHPPAAVAANQAVQRRVKRRLRKGPVKRFVSEDTHDSWNPDIPGGFSVVSFMSIRSVEVWDIIWENELILWSCRLGLRIYWMSLIHQRKPEQRNLWRTAPLQSPFQPARNWVCLTSPALMRPVLISLPCRWASLVWCAGMCPQNSVISHVWNPLQVKNIGIHNVFCFFFCRQMTVTSGNQLVECQECHNLYHQDCHKPQVTDKDVNDPRLVWYCARCTRQMKRMVRNGLHWVHCNLLSDTVLLDVPFE